MKQIVLTQWNNRDISINDYSQQLLDLCIAAKLRIINDRTREDLRGHITYIGNKGHNTLDLVLASEISLLQSGLIQHLSVLDLNHLSDHRHILLKLSSLNPISTHSLGNQTEPMNVTLVEKQPQYKWKKTLEKDFVERLSREIKKVTDLINNTNIKSISDINGFLGKIQNAFISATDIVLKENFRKKKIIKKCKQQKR